MKNTPTASFRRRPESRNPGNSWIPGRAPLARNDVFPLLSGVLQEPLFMLYGVPKGHE
jgi:hypothetical protein